LRPAGHALDGVVPAAGADDGADEDALVGDSGDLRERLANLDASDLGRDRLELAADLLRGVGLEVPHILVGRPAAEEDVDDRFVRGTRDAARLFGAQDISK
jgi:hypothetical protein